MTCGQWFFLFDLHMRSHFLSFFAHLSYLNWSDAVCVSGLAVTLSPDLSVGSPLISHPSSYPPLISLSSYTILLPPIARTPHLGGLICTDLSPHHYHFVLKHPNYFHLKHKWQEHDLHRMFFFLMPWKEKGPKVRKSNLTLLPEMLNRGGCGWVYVCENALRRPWDGLNNLAKGRDN